ncbi:MAG: hypothetical protein P4M15_00195 [Alphaproteobacteria bacterium]|nr:hypothetical protein [Alphaproteobacteria bacterium]
MAQRKGRTGNPNGRPKGVPNKVTNDLRETVVKFVNENSHKFQSWLDDIQAEHGSLEAFKRVEALLEYAMPKHQRIEVSGTNGLPMQVTLQRAFRLFQIIAIADQPHRTNPFVFAMIFILLFWRQLIKRRMLQTDAPVNDVSVFICVLMQRSEFKTIADSF